MKPSLTVRLGVVFVACSAVAAVPAASLSSGWSAPVAALAGFALGLVPAGVALVLLHRRVSLPLRALAEHAGHLSRGEFSSVPKADLAGEMAVMAEAYAAMAKALKQRIGGMEGILAGLSLAYPFLTVDPKGMVTRCNSLMVDLLGKTGGPERHVGGSVREFLYADASRRTIIEQAMAERRPVESEITIRSASGRELALHVNASPLFDMDGALMGGFATYYDLTDLRRGEASVREKNTSIAAIASQCGVISEEVGAAAEDLASRIENANADATSQRERMQETAAAMEQMNAAVLEVASNAASAAEQAADASGKSRQGAQRVHRLVEQIGRVDGVIEALASRIADLGSRADGIGQVMNVINDIADQTNLLALNAAIEAARAGDAGRGFAVVADEVRKLAEKTMSATQEVGSVIRAIQESTKAAASEMTEATLAVEEATSGATDSGKALEDILALSERTSDQVGAIATAAEEQSASSEQINRAIDEVNGLAGQTMAIMNRAATDVFSLAGQANDLSRLITGIRDPSALEAEERLPCWVFKKCGREKGGNKVHEMGVCPAWPDDGYSCATVTGTFCGGTVQETFATKIGSCAKCDYFKSGSYDRDTMHGKAMDSLARQDATPGATARKPAARGKAPAAARKPAAPGASKPAAPARRG